MEPLKNEYAKIIMDLIYFDMRLERIMANTDHIEMRKVIDILRYYRQFAPDND